MGITVACPLAMAAAVAVGLTYIKVAIRYSRQSAHVATQLRSLRFSGWRLVWCGRTVRAIGVVLAANVGAGLLAAGRELCCGDGRSSGRQDTSLTRRSRSPLRVAFDAWRQTYSRS